MLQIFQETAAELRSANFFTIIVDEATDVANISRLTLCIQWVDDKLDCRKDFIRLYSLDVANAKTIVAVIKDVILRMNSNLKNCRGQCYDGYSTMKTGVAKQKMSVAKQVRSRSLVVSELSLETQGSQFEPGCQLCAEVSSLQ